MRTTTFWIWTMVAACSGASERPAQEPEAPAEREASEGFTDEQKEELSELLGVDVDGAEQGAGDSDPAEDAPPAP